MTIATIRAAFAATLSPLMGWGSPAPARNANRLPASGSVTPACPPPSTDGAAQMPALPLDVLLNRRAVRVCNRNPDLTAKYLRRHVILGRGVYSDV